MIQTKVYRVSETKYKKRERWKQMKQLFPNEQKKQNNLKQRLIRDFERKQSNDSHIILVCIYNECTRFIVSGKSLSIKPNGLLIFNESNQVKKP